MILSGGKPIWLQLDTYPRVVRASRIAAVPVRPHPEPMI